MKQHKTHEEWQNLIQLRQAFEGTHVEFCKIHQISLKTFYRRRAKLGLGQANKVECLATEHVIPKQNPLFVPVKTTLVSAAISVDCSIFAFNLQTGVLSFPQSLPMPELITLLRGLSR